MGGGKICKPWHRFLHLCIASGKLPSAKVGDIGKLDLKGKGVALLNIVDSIFHIKGVGDRGPICTCIQPFLPIIFLILLPIKASVHQLACKWAS